MEIIAVTLLVFITIAMVFEKPIRIVIIKQEDNSTHAEQNNADIENFNKEQEELQHNVAAAIQNAMGVMSDE